VTKTAVQVRRREAAGAKARAAGEAGAASARHWGWRAGEWIGWVPRWGTPQELIGGWRGTRMPWRRSIRPEPFETWRNITL